MLGIVMSWERWPDWFWFKVQNSTDYIGYYSPWYICMYIRNIELEHDIFESWDSSSISLLIPPKAQWIANLGEFMLGILMSWERWPDWHWFKVQKSTSQVNLQIILDISPLDIYVHQEFWIRTLHLTFSKEWAVNSIVSDCGIFVFTNVLNTETVTDYDELLFYDLDIFVSLILQDSWTVFRTEFMKWGKH